MQSQLKIHGAVCFRGAVRRDTVNEVGMVTRSGPENATEGRLNKVRANENGRLESPVSIESIGAR